MTKPDEGACENTDRELWRERFGDFYANSIHVTAQGAVGINVGGHVIVQSLNDWHAAARAALAEQPAPTQPARVVMSDEWLRAEFAKKYPSDIGILELSEANSEFRLEAIGARHHWRAFENGARAVIAEYERLSGITPAKGEHP